MHIVIKNFFFFCIRKGIFYAIGLGFFQCYGFSYVIIFKRQYLIWIKTKYILVSNTVCNAVSMQLISKNCRGRTEFLLVFILYRRAGEAKEDSLRKRLLNGHQHITESRAVTFVDNKDNPLAAHEAISAAFSPPSPSSFILLIF